MPSFLSHPPCATFTAHLRIRDVIYSLRHIMRARSTLFRRNNVTAPRRRRSAPPPGFDVNLSMVFDTAACTPEMLRTAAVNVRVCFSSMGDESSVLLYVNSCRCIGLPTPPRTSHCYRSGVGGLFPCCTSKIGDLHWQDLARNFH